MSETAQTGSDRPIFIVGCARSGTTLLQLMLHSHPRIAIPPETRYLFDIYQRRRKFGNLRKKSNRAKLAAFIIDGRGTAFGDLELDKELIRKKIIDGPPTLGSAAGIILREYAAVRGKARWGDKRPNYIERIPVLMELFPDAQIVHIIRDGRDCVSSLKKMPWWMFDVNTSAYKWIRAIRAGEEARATLRPDQYYEFRYEDLVAQPEAELRKLCAFLGEEFSPAMLEHHKAAEDAVPENKRQDWHRNVVKEVNAQAVGRWQKDLEPWELALIEKMGRRELLKYNYGLCPNPPKLPWRRRLDYNVRVNYLDEGLRKRNESIRAKRHLYKQPVAAKLTAGQLEYYQKMQMS